VEIAPRERSGSLDGLARLGDAPRGTREGVFYEKAPNVKAALAAVLTWFFGAASVPESSIRTLKESFVGLGALWGSTAAALLSLQQPRRLRRPAQSPTTGD